MMHHASDGRRVYTGRVTLIAAALVVAGFLLTSVSWWFLLLSVMGSVGPGVLRECGLLQDCDEFQRLARYRAGYHATLATMGIGLALLAGLRAASASPPVAQDAVIVLLSIAWFVWLFSSLTAYWGVKRAAQRLLALFGTLWMAFVILSNTGPEWRGLGPLLMHSLLPLAFWLPALAVSRFPLVAALLMLAAGVGLVVFFGLLQADLKEVLRRGVVGVLFIGPLLASGIAVLVEEIRRPTGSEASHDDA